MKGQQNQQQPSTGMDLIYIVAFFMAVAVAGWYFYHPQIVSALFLVRTLEAQVIQSVLTIINDLLSIVFLPKIDAANINLAIQNMTQSDVATINFQQVAIVSAQVGGYLCVPAVIIAGLLSSHLIFFKATARYKEKYSMTTLRAQEKVNWPEIYPVINTNLIKTGIDELPWSMSKQPLEFAKEHNLLNRIVVDHRPAVEVDKGKAFALFTSQLTRRWSTLRDFRTHELALFAAFAAKIGGDDKGSKAFLQQMSKSALSGKINYSGTHQLLRKHVKHKIVGKAVSPHAYVMTAMASLLEAARATGVLASAEFLWLKRVDRNLWYMLSSVGRQTPFPEVAGVFAHWIIEKKLRRPLKVPMVNEAVAALDVAIKDILYNPDED